MECGESGLRRQAIGYGARFLRNRKLVSDLVAVGGLGVARAAKPAQNSVPGPARAAYSSVVSLKALGTDSMNRAVHALSVSSAEDVPGGGLSDSKHFACLVLWDSSDADVREADGLLSSLLLQGASYLMFWGPGCTRMHDIADETIVELRDRLGLEDGATVMTTDHHGESLEDTAWDFRNVSSPHSSLCATTRSALVITIGAPAWAEEAELILSRPS